MINNKKIAYKIGFSVSLSRYSISVYNELALWNVSEEDIVKSFTRGYREGLRIKKKVSRDNILAAAVRGRDQA